MAKKTIPELDDGIALQGPDAIVAFSQGGQTFFGRVRPNPTQQINVINQAQLEASILGTDLEIPDNTNVTIVIDASFTLDKPIKLGSLSGLDFKFSTIGPAINWIGPGKMIQNTTPGVAAQFLIIDSVNVTGDNTNSIFDVLIQPFGFLALRALNVDSLDSIGVIESPVVFIASLTGFGINAGLVLKNCLRVTIDNAVVGNFSATNTTWITFINEVPIILVVAKDISASNTVDGDSLFFIDPNSPVGSSFSITSSGITDSVDEGIFYQLGVDIAIIGVTNNGSGKARYTTAITHGLSTGKPNVLSGFLVETDYNETIIVTDTPTPTTFDTDQDFTAGDTGNMNTSSLDQTDIRVTALGNRNTPDSKTLSESSINGTLEVDGSGGVDVPIVDITPVSGDWVEDPTTEEFSVDDTTGLVTYNGVKIITAMVKYSLRVEEASGPSQDLIIDLHINGVSEPKATVLVTTVAGGIVASYIGGNFTINPGDTFQLFKDNTTNTNNTLVSNTTLLINED